MAVASFEDLSEHVGHNVVVVEYGNPDVGVLNVAIECEDCYEVLVDFDKSDEPEVYTTPPAVPAG